MTAPLTPGAYLKHRRQAAGLGAADVAARLATVPRLAEHARTEWLELIEADATPASFDTIVALNRIYRFDLVVLATLAAIALGGALAPPRLCRICACSDHDACTGDDDGDPCGWACDDFVDDHADRTRASHSDLCTRCANAFAEAC